jgi:hypothetical protein
MNGERIELKGPITADDLLALHEVGHVEELSHELRAVAGRRAASIQIPRSNSGSDLD